jgi:hypothetical protein
MQDHDPWSKARDEGTDLARAGMVLRDVDGSMLVRSGWFLAFVRSIAPSVGHTRLPTLMARAGWQSPRRIKATSPTSPAVLGWNFYVIPAGWDVDR